MPEECEFWGAGGIKTHRRSLNYSNRENPAKQKRGLLSNTFFLQLKVVLGNRTAGE